MRVVFTFIVLVVMQTHEQAPRFLLIVRERLHSEMEKAYDKNEQEIAAVCAALNCPHPYLALASTTGPKEVWWLNAFVSEEEKDGVDAAYRRNEPLMARLLPLTKRNDGFRDVLSTTLTKHRQDLSGGAAWRIAGARFFVVNVTRDERATEGSVFESADGERFVMAATDSGEAAERLAARLGPGATILAVQPQWSFPAKAWIAADPAFWKPR